MGDEKDELRATATVDVVGPILVVDDDPDLRNAITRILRAGGHQVVTAHDGASAVHMSMQHRPSLLVLDYMMPGMNGEGVLRAIRSALKDETPPALLVSAGGDVATWADEMGAAQALEKPFRVEELLRAVARHKRHVARDRS